MKRAVKKQNRAAEIGGLPGGQKNILSSFKLSGLVIY